jgi:hypothetical protein
MKLQLCGVPRLGPHVARNTRSPKLEARPGRLEAAAADWPLPPARAGGRAQASPGTDSEQEPGPRMAQRRPGPVARAAAGPGPAAGAGLRSLSVLTRSTSRPGGLRPRRPRRPSSAGQ